MTAVDDYHADVLIDGETVVLIGRDPDARRLPRAATGNAGMA